MKKWFIAPLGIIAILLWATVLVLFINHDRVDIFPADHHKAKTIMMKDERLLSEIRWLDEDTGKDEVLIVETLIGKTALTEEWVEDFTEDGRLSIDTLLASLEVEPSTNE